MKKYHWAFIMDGNGRWASMRGLSRQKGHAEGVKTAKSVIDFCLQTKQISVVSLFVFSTENWNRPSLEVNGLFKLAKQYLVDIDSFVQKGIKVVFSGETNRLPKELLQQINDCIEKTSKCKNMILNLCIDYGGRKEIIQAACKFANAENGAALEDFFYNKLPDPDLIMRTGGQMRLSNFLLFQSAYSELFFSDTLWPDLTNEELDSVFEAFKQRTRNFGKIRKTS